MTRLTLPALLLGATALTFPLAATPAAAQQQNQQSQQNQQATQQSRQDQQQASRQQGDELGACEKLYRLIDEAAGEDILEEFKKAPNVAEKNEADSCALFIKKIEKAGGISKQAQAEGRGAALLTETESFKKRKQLSETVKINRQAVVAGDVTVKQPVPEVDVDQNAPDVEVTQLPSDITVDENPAKIEVRQAPANVHVAMPRPTVTIDQPAPTIVLTMPAPGVNVAQAQPKISVKVPDPDVKVSMKDPKVDVDVQARILKPGEYDQLEQQGNAPKVRTKTQYTNAQGQPVEEGVNADVKVRKQKPQVRFLANDLETQYKFNRAKPQVVYQPAEPNIDVSFAERPHVEVHQTGEPKVRIVRKGEDQANAGRQDQQNRQASAGDQNRQNRQSNAGQQGQQNAYGEQDQQANAGQQQGQQTNAGQRTGAGQQSRSQQSQQANAGQQGQQNGEQSQQASAGQQGNDTFASQVERGQAAREDMSQRTGPRLSRETTNAILRAPDENKLGDSALQTVSVGDLEDRDVITLTGNDVGEVKRAVRNNGKTYVIIEHGGFLGIGDHEVAIPAARIALRGNEVVLLGLSENELENMPKYNSGNENELAFDADIDIGTYQ